MLRTLAYADIFDYPLTKNEVKRWLITSGSDPEGFKFPIGSDPIVKTRGFYHLRGRSNLVSIRRRRERISREKLVKIKNLVFIFKLIPWINLVCVTGALAMNNADKNDDIDLMIITASNRLWLTRLLVSLLLWPHLRGGRMDSSKAADKLCVNLWLDETVLAIKQQDLYTAHETCQAKPIFERDNFYQRFITANLWVKRYLPNALTFQGPTLKFKSPKRSDPTGFLDLLAFRFQHWFMRRKMTRERVGRHYAFFHPRPTGKIVLAEYRKRLKHLRGERSSHLGGVVLVTGCFDILHAEHRKLLVAAKKLGGRLLVGVETDARIRRLKGPGRPVNSLADRLANLQQWRIADEVFALPEKFDEPEDYEKLIADLRPDILAVSQSTPFMTNKKELMPKYGGKVVVVLPHNPNISTTKMLESK